MYLIRDVFHAKPGKAKDLVGKFKQAMAHMEGAGLKSWRVMTDAVASYWTVVVEIEVDELQTYLEGAARRPENRPAMEAMQGYMELVTGGYREIFRVE